MSFGEIITYPFSWLLLTFYEWTGNYGVSVLAFALAVKLVLLPFQMKSKRSTMRTARLTPIMKDLEKKYGDNKAKYQQEVAKFYKDEKINPMSGCLWSIIPFPILIALYSVIRQPLTRLMRLTAEQVTAITERLANLDLYTIPEKANAYSEITLANLVHENYHAFQGISDRLIDLDFSFLGMNLGQRPQWNFFLKVDWSDPSVWGPALGLFMIPVISALLSYFAMKISSAANPPAMEAQQQSMKGMMLFMPLFSVYIGFIMPAALGIYWIAGSVLGIIQDAILNKHYKKILDVEDEERRKRLYAREEELERKRLETEKLREIGATERNKNTSKKKLQAAERTQQEERLAAEKARQRAQSDTQEDNGSQVGNRKYARGRAYVEDRFNSDEASYNDENGTETSQQAGDAGEDGDNA